MYRYMLAVCFIKNGCRLYIVQRTAILDTTAELIS